MSLRFLSFSSNDDRWRPSVRHSVHSADTEVGKEEVFLSSAIFSLIPDVAADKTLVYI